MDRTKSKQQTKLDSIRRKCVSIYRNIQSTWSTKHNSNKQVNRIRKRCYYYFCILTIGIIPVEAFANAVSQSNNGSVTNMAIQSINGNMTTQQFGNNIVCQGATLSFSPFVTFGANYRKPYRDYYETPFYDPTDANDDGVPDNPGNVLFNQKNYSGTNKDSYALNFGISATFSIPLDRGLQNQCKSAADTQISIQKQVLENKRLDWQIARIRECGKLKQEGIMLATDSPFFNICKDVYLVPKANQVIPHTHKLK